VVKEEHLALLGLLLFGLRARKAVEARPEAVATVPTPKVVEGVPPPAEVPMPPPAEVPTPQPTPPPAVVRPPVLLPPPVEECTTYHQVTLYVKGRRTLTVEGARVWRLYFVVRGYETTISDGERVVKVIPPEPVSYGDVRMLPPATAYIDYHPPRDRVTLTVDSAEAHVEVHVNYYALSKVVYEDPHTVRAYEC